MKDTWMRKAIELSLENVTSQKGGPFGAVVVNNGQIVGVGSNQVTSSNDPTAHAEVVAIRAACKRLNSFQLTGCQLYTSCEPCPMCLGAIYWSHLDRVYFGNTREDAARIGFDDEKIYSELALPFSRRSVPMEPLLREEALQAFEEWQRSASKIPY